MAIPYMMTDTRMILPPAAMGLEAVVGNTPLVPLRRVTAHLPPHVQVLAKAEWLILAAPSGTVRR